MSNFFSGIAVFASLLALVGSGYSVIQLFSLQQKLDTTISQLNNTIKTNPPTTNPPPSVNNPSPSDSSNTSSQIQPGQFVRNAFGNLAQIELLKVNRVPEQPTKVNVQIRVRLKPGAENEGGLILKSFYLSEVTARNPANGETYNADLDKATSGGVNLKVIAINEQASADAYVWLNVPQNVNSIDIYIPNTEAFTNVPISNS
jgi:hypothetical protein